MIGRWFRAAGLVVLSIGLAGCVDSGTATPDAPVFRKISDARIHPGDAVPEPDDTVVLTVTGKLGPAAGADDTLTFDMDTLEDLGLVEIQVDDQIAEGRFVVFQGVLLRTLLDVGQLEPGVTTLTLLALNDYQVEIPLAEAYALPVLIATRADGQRMSIEHYGPIRIIYPFGLLPLQQAVHEPRSIWQLYLIRAD